MTRETLMWLHWLVSSQSVSIAAPDAVEQVAAARAALAEIDTALETARATILGDDAAMTGQG